MVPGTLSRIGKYEITGILGQGGMGVVYRAEDKRIGREVAIKTLTAGYSGDPEVLERFYREAQAGVLQHPNIVIVYDLGDQDGMPYIVMECIKGESLEKIIVQRPQVSIMEKLDIVAQVCNALNYAHQQGVIHRDIKPGNVMVQPDGAVKLVDFGIARQEKSDLHSQQRNLTRMGNVIGSLNYIAPERFRNEPVGGPSDIFSAGVLLYQFLAGGTLPFAGADDFAIAHQIVNTPHPPLSQYVTGYPAELDQVLDRALAKNPADRYATAAEMEADLVPLRDSLKGQRVAELFAQAQTMAGHAELVRARDVLWQVVKIDAQHTAARTLLNEVQQSLSKQQRVEQVRQFRLQAEEALQQKLYQSAIHALQQALKLEPENAEMTSLLSSTTETLRRKEQLETLIREAEAARYAGDYDAALQIVTRAVSVDAQDTHVKAIYAAIARDAADRARQHKTRDLVEAARQEISSRRFTQAHDLLRQVGEIDPDMPELHALLNLAKAGHQQELRRKELERINGAVDQALSQQDYAGALEIANGGVKKFPGDPALLKLQALAERQFNEQREKKFVDEQTQAVRALLQQGQSSEALAAVEKALAQAPRDSRLISLKSIVREGLELQRAESTKSEHLGRAREAIGRKEYTQAVQLLELLSGQEALSGEVQELLDFARAEAAGQERQAQVDAARTQGEQLIEQGNFSKAMEILEATLQRWPDQALQVLLKQAREQEEQLGRKIQQVLRQAQDLVESGKHGEALNLLKSQPENFRQSASFHQGAEKLKERVAGEQAVKGAIQKARAALQAEDLQQAGQILQAARQAYGEPEILKQAVLEFEAQRQTLARSRVQQAMEHARTAMLEGQSQQALDLLRRVADFTQFVPTEMQAEWERLGNQVAGNLAAGKRPSAPATKEAAFMAGPMAGPGREAVAAPAQGVVAAQARKTSSKTMIWAGVALAVVIGGALLFLRPKPSYEQQTTYTQINAQPWGTVQQVIPEKGSPIEVHDRTPVRVAVPAGNFTVVIQDPEGNEQHSNCSASGDHHDCSVMLSTPPVEDIIKNSK